MKASKRGLFHRLVLALFAILTAAALLPFFSIDRNEIKKYQKARQSRRGEIRTARDEKKKISLQQDREETRRQLWIPEGDAAGSEREVFIQAEQASIETTIGPKEVTAIESFTSPSGWIQESLYWIISGTGTAVFPQNKKEGDTLAWSYDKEGKKPVPLSEYPEIEPWQRTRYFDAARAEWNLATNEITTHSVAFCIAEMPGHEAPKKADPAHITISGTARSMMFRCNSSPTEISSSGIQFYRELFQPLRQL